MIGLMIMFPVPVAITVVFLAVLAWQQWWDRDA